MVTFMKCYDVHSKELAIIENNAISEITHHSKGVYIYWKDYDSLMGDYIRAGHVVCDWTKCETVSNEIWQYIKAHSNVPVITVDVCI